MNISLINWDSKNQSTIETSEIGTVFVAQKVGVHILCVIQIKLRMIGIPILGVSYVYGDNMLVIHNTSNSELTLKKKCNAIAYHAICKSVAMGEPLTRHV